MRGDESDLSTAKKRDDGEVHNVVDIPRGKEVFQDGSSIRR